MATAAPVTRTDMLGRESVLTPAQGRLAVPVSTSPCYLVSPAPATAATIAARAYPQDQPAGDFVLANPMTDAAAWTLDHADRALEALDRTYLPWRTAGTFTLAQVTDDARGACLELALQPRAGAPLSPLIGEYTVLRLRQPVPVPGTPATLGIWVHGNANWGKITWELQDAEGEVWRSIGTGGWGCDIYDWPGETAVNFDGWCFLRVPLSEASPARTINPGGVVSQWVCAGGGNKRLDYPLRLTAVGVTMYRQALVLTQMQPVPNLRLRFGGLGAQDFAP
jgi:hypothetical protein